jgi:peptidoglycan/LPS O-acetylase OafA/YrhL
VNIGREPFHLVLTPVFDHLWFLWFLCWMVPAFAAVAWCVDRWRWAGPPREAILSPSRFLWLLPLTLIPEWFMGLGSPSFGPDTSIGILPMPHVLLYYGIFFGFGALYYESRDVEGRLGRLWPVLLPAAFLVALPVAVVSMGYRPVTIVAQAVYAWAMSFGLMGLFRRVVPRENKAIRYVSDASYWLYLAHLPLIIAAQAFVRDWPFPAGLKFLLVGTVVTGFLLLTYQTLVRYTWLGALLNGPRTRPEMRKTIS